MSLIFGNSRAAAIEFLRFSLASEVAPFELLCLTERDALTGVVSGLTDAGLARLDGRISEDQVLIGEDVYADWLSPNGLGTLPSTYRSVLMARCR